MPLWKDGAFVEDEWTVVGDEDPVPADGPAFVSLKRWRAEREALSSRDAAIGIVLLPDSEWSDVIADLPRFPAIAISFPKFMDGRGFSLARLLRDRDGFKGEIRAVGEFTIDQMPLMRRVGFDSFLVVDDNVRAGLLRGVWPEVPQYLQPIDADREAPAGKRPWARRPADS